ncbi:unnamed protein product [Rhodiola kirilowii]
MGCRLQAMIYGSYLTVTSRTYKKTTATIQTRALPQSLLELSKVGVPSENIQRAERG